MILRLQLNFDDCFRISQPRNASATCRIETDFDFHDSTIDIRCRIGIEYVLFANFETDLAHRADNFAVKCTGFAADGGGLS